MSEKLSEREKRLLRQQAEAYAFIHDVKEVAQILGTNWVLARMQGIEETIEKRRQEYPRIFQRYFNQARERAAATKATSNVQGKDIPRRKAEEKERPKPQKSHRPKRGKGQEKSAKREAPE